MLKKLVFLGLCLLLALPALRAQKVRDKNFIGDKKIYYGAAYYPESWDYSEMEQDIERMKELNMNVMRIAEFSWALMEPTEDHYEWDWLHKIVDKLGENGIQVILGTPSATPPAWAWEKYPSIARTRSDGSKEIHGARRSTSYSSKAYQKLTAEVVTEMAKEFGDDPNVIGWQTDNEFHLSPDYSQETEKQWHAWLKERYKTIENLNEKWDLTLWSQTYQSFDQVPMPHKRMWHHPSLRYFWHQFSSEEVEEFQAQTVDIIRKYSDAPITHDGMPGQELDYEELFEDLDFMATNNYHSFEAYDRIVSNYDRMRGYNKGFHWLTETAPNHSGGGKSGQTWFLHMPPGSFHAALWINHALGGQGTLFWLWRQHWGGHEMVHGSIVSAWGKPTANYEDIQQLGADLNKTSDFQMNNPVSEAQVAMVYSHKAATWFEIEEYANGLDYYKDWTYRFFVPVMNQYLHRDVIHENVPLDQYKVLFCPLLPYMQQSFKDKVKNWVEKGGTLIMGPMSGYRSKEMTSYKNHAYGPFGQWTGITVENRLPIGTEPREKEPKVFFNWNMPFEFSNTQCFLWSEELSTEEGRVLATYSGGSGMQGGKPAVVENQKGRGKVVVLGTDPGKEAVGELVLHYARQQGVAPLATGDPGVVIGPRGENAEGGFILSNITGKNRDIELQGRFSGTDLLTGENYANGRISLEPYEVKVLKRQ